MLFHSQIKLTYLGQAGKLQASPSMENRDCMFLGQAGSQEEEGRSWAKYSWFFSYTCQCDTFRLSFLLDMRDSGCPTGILGACLPMFFILWLPCSGASSRRQRVPGSMPMWGKRPLPVSVLGRNRSRCLVSEYPEVSRETIPFILIWYPNPRRAPASLDKAYQPMQPAPREGIGSLFLAQELLHALKTPILLLSLASLVVAPGLPWLLSNYYSLLSFRDF